MVRDSSTATLAQGSDLGSALDLGVDLLGEEGTADRVILVVSDGEDNEKNALEAAQRAADAGIHLYAIGVGTTEGAPVPRPGGGFKQTPGGEIVLSKLDETTLKAIAATGRGAYVRSGVGVADVRGIYVDEIRGKLQTAELGVRREKIWNERFTWPLTGAFLLLVLAGCLRPGPLRLPGVAMAWMIAALAVSGRAYADDAAAQWVERASDLAAEQVLRPDDLTTGERLGEALFRAGDYNAAHQVLTDVADRTTNLDQRHRARSNAGLSAYRGGQLTRALEDWQRVLQDAPEHPAAKQNAQAVQAEIAKRLQEEPPPQDDNEGDPQDGKGGDTGQPQDQPQSQGDSGQSSQGDAPEQPPEASDSEAQQTEEDPGDRGEIAEAGSEEENQNPRSGGQDTGQNDEERTLARPGSISEDEAERMLEAVEEGSPAVPQGAASKGGLDW